MKVAPPPILSPFPEGRYILIFLVNIAIDFLHINIKFIIILSNKHLCSVMMSSKAGVCVHIAFVCSKTAYGLWTLDIIKYVLGEIQKYVLRCIENYRVIDFN